MRSFFPNLGSDMDFFQLFCPPPRHEQPFLPKQVILEEGKDRAAGVTLQNHQMGLLGCCFFGGTPREESILTILLHGMIEVEAWTPTPPANEPAESGPKALNPLVSDKDLEV